MKQCLRNKHCVKIVRVWSFSGPYFSEFGLNTERYQVSLRIQSKCRKIRNWESPNIDTFHLVKDNERNNEFWNYLKHLVIRENISEKLDFSCYYLFAKNVLNNKNQFSSLPQELMCKIMKLAFSAAFKVFFSDLQSKLFWTDCGRSNFTARINYNDLSTSSLLRSFLLTCSSVQV